MANAMKPPCKDCECRHPHCHSHCMEYIDYQTEREKYLQWKSDRNNEERWLNHSDHKKKCRLNAYKERCLRGRKYRKG